MQDYYKNKYFETLISQNKNNVNPNLKFDTPLNFKKKLDDYVNNLLISQKIEKIKFQTNMRPMSSSATNNLRK
jgi:hypothetical protein